MEEMNKMISDDMFAYMVAEDVKNKLSSSQKSILMEKENWQKWQKCLLVLINNLEEQPQRILFYLLLENLLKKLPNYKAR